jgi:hypothetical protein
MCVGVRGRMKGRIRGKIRDGEKDGIRDGKNLEGVRCKGRRDREEEIEKRVVGKLTILFFYW